MIKKNLVALLFSGLVYNATYSQVIKNYNQADGLAVTDTLNLTNFKFGVSSNGGGMINKLGLILGGTVVDIMNGTSRSYTKPNTSTTYNGISESKTFGRGGQATIRDAAHGGRYNPTQAGFNEFLGTPVNITKNARTLKIDDHQMALWYGDGEYDFTSWENIGSDFYTPHASSPSVIGFDDDGVNESVSPYLLPNKQLDEVGSEFNYYGTYTDYTSTINPTNSTAIASVVRNFFELAYVGESSNANLGNPANCLRQFQKGFKRTVNNDTQPDGSTPILNTNAFRSPIFKTIPTGTGYNFSTYGASGANGTGDSYDMNSALVPFRLRYDTEKWQNANQVVYINKNGGIVTLSFPFVQNDAIAPPTSGTNAQITDNRLIGISDGTTVLAIYRPNTNINNNFVIGRDAPGRPVAIYQDNRMITAADKVSTSASYSSGGSVTNSLGVFGFVTAFSGMYNRHSLPSIDIYEVFRAEYYIIAGPKNTLAATIAAIDGSLTIVNSTTTPIANGSLGNDISLASSAVKIEIYPNPVTSMLNIKLINQKATDINVYNESGKLVFTKASVVGNITIPKTQIGGAGVYFIKTETETKQFIIAQ